MFRFVWLYSSHVRDQHYSQPIIICRDVCVDGLYFLKRICCKDRNMSASVFHYSCKFSASLFFLQVKLQHKHQSLMWLCQALRNVSVTLIWSWVMWCDELTVALGFNEVDMTLRFTHLSCSSVFGFIEYHECRSKNKCWFFQAMTARRLCSCDGRLIQH